MRKILVTTAMATVLSAGAFLTSGANAMTLTAPAGVRLATEGANVVEPVRHRCYRTNRGRLVCNAHRRVIVAPAYGYGYGYPSYGYGYGYGYPSVGIGLGWGGYGWGGGHRTVIHRGGHHHHRGHRR